MQESKDYKILSVEPRQAFSTEYGEMQPYALTLEGVEGYVQLTQKPETAAPAVNSTIHGYTYKQGSYLKFKKVNPEYNERAGSKPQGSVDSEYHTQLLEAIAVAVGAEQAVKSRDNSDDVDDRPIDLSEIPF